MIKRVYVGLIIKILKAKLFFEESLFWRYKYNFIKSQINPHMYKLYNKFLNEKAIK
jgi:hypothetical protein